MPSTLRKPLDQMSPVELCEEAARVRSLITDHAEKLSMIYSSLYSNARRTLDDMSYSYISIANSGKRFSGMVIQAARRTAGVEHRIFVSSSREAEDRERRKQEESKRLAALEDGSRRARATNRDPLEVLYGIPVVSSEVEIDLMNQGLLDRSSSEADVNVLYGEELP